MKPILKKKKFKTEEVSFFHGDKNIVDFASKVIHQWLISISFYFTAIVK